MTTSVAPAICLATSICDRISARHERRFRVVQGQRIDENVRRWIDDLVDAQFWLSVLVVGEIQRGIELIGRRDQPAASALKAWLDSTIADYGDRIIPITTAVCLRWARLSVPDPLPIVDGLLAATALEHGLSLVTRNVADVQRTGAAVINPFDPPPRGS